MVHSFDDMLRFEASSWTRSPSSWIYFRISSYVDTLHLDLMQNGRSWNEFRMTCYV